MVVFVNPNSVSPAAIGPDRTFPSPGDGEGELYIDSQAGNMTNEEDSFSLTSVYGSTLFCATDHQYIGD